MTNKNYDKKKKKKKEGFLAKNPFTSIPQEVLCDFVWRRRQTASRPADLQDQRDQQPDARRRNHRVYIVVDGVRLDVCNRISLEDGFVVHLSERKQSEDKKQQINQRTDRILSLETSAAAETQWTVAQRNMSVTGSRAAAVDSPAAALMCADPCGREIRSYVPVNNTWFPVRAGAHDDDHGPSPKKRERNARTYLFDERRGIFASVSGFRFCCCFSPLVGNFTSSTSGGGSGATVAAERRLENT